MGVQRSPSQVVVAIDSHGGLNMVAEEKPQLPIGANGDGGRFHRLPTGETLQFFLGFDQAGGPCPPCRQAIPTAAAFSTEPLGGGVARPGFGTCFPGDPHPILSVDGEVRPVLEPG